MHKLEIITKNTLKLKTLYFFKKEDAEKWAKDFYYIVGYFNITKVSFFKALHKKLIGC